MDAIRKCEMILKHCEDFCEIQLLNVELHVKKGDLDTAKRLIDSLKANGSNEVKYNPLLNFYKGQAVLYSGNEESALKIFRDVQISDPELKCVSVAMKNIKKSKELNEEGKSFYKQEKVKDAISKWEEAAKLDPFNRKFNSLVYGNLMTGYNKLNKNEDALRCINEAIRCDEKYSKAYMKRAEIYKKIENYSEAIADLQMAQTLNPSLNLKGDIQILTKKKTQVAKAKNYYDILGVKKDATKQEISKAYRQ